MKNSEKLVLHKISEQSRMLRREMGSLSMGQMIKMIRTQLGMPQQVLAQRAKIPQPSLSRIERGVVQPRVQTLQKLLGELNCSFVWAPILEVPIDEQRVTRAKSVAKKQVKYLEGTMSLEEQKPSKNFLKELERERQEELLRTNKLWDSFNEEF